MHNSVCSGWCNVWLVQRCAPGALGLKLAQYQYVQCIVIMFESCFFQFKLCLEINNTMETVVDSSNVGFKYMNVCGCGSEASVVLRRWDGEETLH